MVTKKGIVERLRHCAATMGGGASYMLNQAAREAADELEQREWRPIETAPKDRYVLGYDPHLKRPFVMIWNVTDQAFAVCGSAFDDETPTHWMPLPAPPSNV